MSASATNLRLAPKLKGFLLALAGTGFLAISLVGVVITRGFIARAQRAEATVVSLYAGPAHPKLEFVGPNGVRIEFYGSGWASHRVGDRVPVLFLESDPETTAKIAEPESLWFLPGMFGVLGASALLIGCLVMFRRKGRLED